jgi:hypothetical protein
VDLMPTVQPATDKAPRHLHLVPETPEPNPLVEIAEIACTTEVPEYMDGVLAGLALAERPDLRDLFLAAVSITAALDGASLAELIELERRTAAAL